MTDLAFEIRGAQPKPHAASPTIAFRLHTTATEPIEAMVLRVELRIEPQWRTYDGQEKALLNDLFGTPERWHTTLRTFSWADVPVTVPGFAGETESTIEVPCTYDFDVAATRFMNALGGGEIPLRFFFSGAVFRYGERGFSTERVAWSSECAYRMPLAVWRDALRACYGDDAMIRIGRETLDVLARYRSLMGATNWNQVILNLLENAGQRPGAAR